MVTPKTPKHISSDHEILDNSVDTVDFIPGTIGMNKFKTFIRQAVFEVDESEYTYNNIALQNAIASMPVIQDDLTLDTKATIKSYHFGILSGAFKIVLDAPATDTVVVRCAFLRL